LGKAKNLGCPELSTPAAKTEAGSETSKADRISEEAGGPAASARAANTTETAKAIPTEAGRSGRAATPKTVSAEA
jgi:hypothetical protein